ncbi:MAG TPA: helix-turn-helix transcriptional regulator [Thermoanaerobaculia bacterium]|nr:helix-turn-helix transcriptional regulator [Thermoanaerobaculia bacterium]
MSTRLVNCGPALRRLRKARALRQADLAARAGVTKAMISSYEAGRTQSSLASLDKILAALGASLYELAQVLDAVNEVRS